MADTFIWDYATQNDLVIVTKDTDFSDRMLLASPPPRVVHIRLGNMRLRELHAYLANAWPQVEALLHTSKLIDIYPNRIEAAA